ncbi:hypothetical protein ACJIZ3_002556 [Penstemon smallii]|uniref:Uncharacterized protein n=1 Tax=Penstemon smallii TaxID=265156 RepID=A0ABD3U9B8_9LAMI
MEGLERLEQVQRTIELLHSIGISDSNPDSERFLANFTSLLMQQCGEVDICAKCELISKHMSKISSLCIGSELQCETKDCPQLEIAAQLYYDDETNPDTSQNSCDDVAMIGMDAMIRSNSTLEDFCRSYFMFHKMETNQPQSIFRYLPMLSFIESYIYQLDGLNEKLLELPKGGGPICNTDLEVGDPNLDAKSLRTFKRDPFRPLFIVLESQRLLTARISEEFRFGEEYWALERKLCCALVSNKEISIEDVTRAIHLKSFDYRVLNLLLYQLRGEKVNELHMEFLSISELLVEVSDDLCIYVQILFVIGRTTLWRTISMFCVCLLSIMELLQHQSCWQNL